MSATLLGFYNSVTLAAAATSNLYDLVTNTALSYALPKNLPGQCVSLNFTADKALKVAFAAAQLDDTHGGDLVANTPFVDSATGGDGGNTIPLSQIYLYAPSGGGTVTITIYLRFVG
jgi:hypothetical protein